MGELRFPLSWGQQALWFLERMTPGNPAYGIAGAVRVAGEPDAAALERALAALVARHGALRTRFEERAGGVEQVVAAVAHPRLERVEAAAWTAGELERRAFAPFDLAGGEPFRLALWRKPGETVLLLSVHHLVADFASLGVILRELGALYEAERGGEPAALPPAPSYGEWAARERRRLAGPEGERLGGDWEERLRGWPLVLELPADRPGGAGARPGSAVRCRLERPLLDRLRRLGRRQGATPALALLSVFAVLLHRHTGQERLLIGMPTTGRRSPETAGLVGYLVNPVVLGADFAGDPAWPRLLQETAAWARWAFDRQEYPLALLAERLQPEREAGTPPLFQHLFVLQKGRREGEEGLAAVTVGEPGVPLRLGGLETATVALEEPGAQLDLSLTVAELAGDWVGKWQLDRGRFDLSTVARLAGQLGRLLEALADEAAGWTEVPVSQLPLLGAAERQQLLREWSATGRTVGPEGLLHAAFWQRAAERPEATALVAAERRWTYGELAGRAAAIARHLQSLGVGPEVLVGICAGRSGELVAALLGILAAGGAYVPLDPAYPEERLSQTLEASRAPFLVTEQALAPRFAGYRGGQVLLEEIPGEPGPPPAPGTLPDNLAYAIYTSGSTGCPKGVAISHRSARSFLEWALGFYSAEELSGVLASASVCFDISVFELFAPLSAGGTAVLADHALDLPRVADRWEIKLIDVVPSAMSELVSRGSVPDSVVTVNLPGEPLRRRLVEEVYERTAARRVLNLYGPTEDTTYSTVREVSRGEPGEPTLGRPIAGGRGYVIDRHGEPAPLGAHGEMVLAGAGLARGYLNRPELTAERFVPDAWSGRPGEQVYRTGDRVRYLPDGQLVYLGRFDHQVKLRGFRVELGEIEALLRREPGVRDAVAVAEDQRLVAYVEAAAGETGDLRQALARQLPGHMVPAGVQVLAALPRTPNGKVDRRALPAFRPEEAGSAAPRTAAERVLAEIWSELLGVDPVGIHDNFFHLGGHSLLALRLSARVRERLGAEVPLSELFARPTVAGLASRVAAGTASPIPRLPRPHREGGLPLSFAQERLWFLDRMESGAVYNMPGAVRLRGRLNRGALAAAFALAVERHESLRTRFAVAGTRPVQVVDPPAVRALPEVDLQALGGRAEEAVRELAAAEAARPFDLIAGPLLRSLLVRLGPAEHLLLLTLHHIVADGGSLAVLLREVGEAYSAGIEGRRPRLPELAVQYADFAVWQRSELTAERLQDLAAWWRRQLDGLPPVLELPADRPRPKAPSPRGGSLACRLPAELTAPVRGLAREAEATPFLVLLAVWQAVIGRWAGVELFALGTPAAGRDRPELEGMIGFLVNLLVLRSDLSARPDFRTLLRRVRDSALAAYAHQELPFDKLVEALRPEREPGVSPFFQVLFALQEDVFPALRLPELEIARQPVATGLSRYDLSFSLAETAAGWAGGLEFSRELFDTPTLGRLLGRFAAGLRQVLAAPERAVAGLALLAEAERHQLEREWNDVPDRSPGTPGLFARLEEQMDRSPDAIAVVAGESHCSYGGFRRRAERLTARLRRAGVGPEVLVGLFFERSLEQLVSLVAVARAGGAYLPLDPALPAERLRCLLEDARPAVVLTRERWRQRLADLPAAVATWEEGEREASGGEAACSGAGSEMAYVIYTSGSTGTPKGVVVSRGALSAILSQSAADLDPETVILGKFNLSFDAAALGSLLPLAAGARIALVPEGGERDLPALLPRLIDHQVTALGFTSSGYTAFLSQEGIEAVRSLRRGTIGAEVVPADLPARFYARFPRAHLVNFYGPTETTVIALSWTCEPESRNGVPIGRPLPGVEIHLVGRDLAPVPLGAPGELWIGGSGLARGYLRRPDLTASSFVPDPFSGRPGERLYRTGDLARFRTDGAVEFLGRLDQQVKIRGYRIELGEIEAAIREHPEVQDAAVVVQEPAEGTAHRRLVAGYVLRSGAGGGKPELRSFLADRLPAYMIPAAFAALGQLPTLPTGKVDRALLARLPVADTMARARERVLPQTPVEETIAELWAEALGIDRKAHPIGIHDSFFELGGHSLLATRVLLRLREIFDIELPLRALFEEPTVEGVARQLARQLAEGLDEAEMARLLVELE